MSPNLLRIVILQTHLCTTYNHHITSHHRAHNSIPSPTWLNPNFIATTKHYHHPSPSSISDTTFCSGFSRQNTKPRNKSLCDKANQFHYILEKKKEKDAPKLWVLKEACSVSNRPCEGSKTKKPTHNSISTHNTSEIETLHHSLRLQIELCHKVRLRRCSSSIC